MVSKQTNRKDGFTIIEVMIALSVFATAMVLILSAVTFVSKQFQQATNQVALEDASRNIHQQLSQSIQFSGKDLPISTVLNGSYVAWCIGNYMYIFPSSVGASGFSGTEAMYGSVPEGLYAKQDINGSCLSSNVNLTDSTNLLPPGAKVAKFTVDASSGTVTTVFTKSPSDLLDFSKVTSNPGIVQCKPSISGREFCATVKLESAAARRVGV